MQRKQRIVTEHDFIKQFDFYFPEGTFGHKHDEDCEFLCHLRQDLHDFISEKLKQVKEIEHDFIFSRDEAKVILTCLDYTHHRQVKHRKAGMISESFVDTLRKELRENLV